MDSDHMIPLSHYYLATEIMCPLQSSDLRLLIN